MADSSESDDPKGLIREAYRIEGITPGECRSIFLDWALSTQLGSDQKPRITRLLECYGSAEDHPMTQVLREGLAEAPAGKRRGGRAARMKGTAG